MAFVRSAFYNETEMIHSLVLSVTVLRFVIVITAKSPCSIFFLFKMVT